MPITEERIGELTRYGFTETSARVYLALLDLGIAEARDVSTLSRVPTSKIYHTLEQLHERGLVTVYPEYPKRYAPTPLQEFLIKLKSEHEAHAAGIEANLDKLARRYAVKGGVEVGAPGEFTVLRGRRNVMEKAGELMDAAKQEVWLLGTRGTAARMRKVPESVERAHKRGVALRALFPMDASSLPDLDGLMGLYEMRERVLDEEGLGENVAILVVDGGQALITHFSPDDGHLYQGQDAAIYTDHEAMVRALHAMVRALWSGAADYRARRADIEDGRPSTFMRLHTDHEGFRDAVLEALDRGVEEICVMGFAPQGAWHPAWEDAFDHLARSTSARVRFVVDAHDAERLRELCGLLGGPSRVEVRRTRSGAHAKYILFDRREAILALDDATVGAALGDTRQLLLHTTKPEVTGAFGAQFEAAWRDGSELTES